MILQLKRVRKEKNLSQTQLANLIGANLRTIGAWERGETMMSIEQLCRCCEILGTTPNEMTGWYIEHPEDVPDAYGTAADPRRRAMVDAYDALTDDGKTLASETVASLARDPLRRADAAGGSAGHGAAPPRSQSIA